MSASVMVRADPSGPPVFAGADQAHAWLGSLAERHGLDCEGEDTEWLLFGERLILEVLAFGQGESGKVSECSVTHRLSYDDPAQERKASLQLRGVLADLLALAEEVGGELHASDDDMRLLEDDLDWYAGLTDAAAATPDQRVHPHAEFLGIDFHELTKEQAQDLMDRWLADEPARLAWLADRVSAGKGRLFDRADVVLDRSPDSLVSLWRRVRKQLRWRGPDDVFDPARLPVWANSSPAHNHPRFSDDTLWLLDAVARYWAAVLCQATGDRWILGRERVPGYIDQNKPILKRDNASPVRLITIQAAIELDRDERAGDQALRRLFYVRTHVLL